MRTRNEILTDIVHKLLDRTKNGEMKWISYNNTSYSVSASGTYVFYIKKRASGCDFYYIELKIKGEYGEIVTLAAYPGDDGDRRILLSLYDAVVGRHNEYARACLEDIKI
jgi:hypothetical protein